MPTTVIEKVKCFHCGDQCDEPIYLNEKAFCCDGCRTVFEILNTNNLCEYYQLDGYSGLSLKNVHRGSFAYLDADAVRKKLLSFDSPNLSKVTFHVPAIHCVSCIWLLENLRRLDAGILKGEVVFGRKTVSVDFDPTQVELSEIAELLSSLGYPPFISVEDSDKKSQKPVTDRSLLYRLAIAGFCFGNIMLFSFPEYLGLDEHDVLLKPVFSWLNVALSIPVFFYSASIYFTSAIASFRQKQINIDVPIAAGLIALFVRSGYDIITGFGPGYLDSFAGLVFFLLIGRWFQSKTYESFAFDRDFKSYFPLAVSRLSRGKWGPVIIYELKKGDIIKIRNMEIVPTDSLLKEGDAYFDYSFVTGEARPVKAKSGERVYAGGRLIGQPVELIVEKETSQSHLTSLWNNEAFKKTNESSYQKIIDRAARKFTWIVMGLAACTALYWYIYSPGEMWLVLTSVLMVACPCALALAAPFTYGTMQRVFGRSNFYLKNADVIERLASIDAVVFDKTGTVTYGKLPDVEFTGKLTDSQMLDVKLLTSCSTHPLSGIVSRSILGEPGHTISAFKEIPGKGIQATINGKLIQVGSAEYLGFYQVDRKSSYVFVGIDNEVKGYFRIKVNTRPNLKKMVERLGDKCMAVLSGDNGSDGDAIKTLFNSSVLMRFNQSPHDKLEFVKRLQLGGKKVMMVGDGLNDSGALQQSDVGIAVSDDSGVFSPACDGILDGKRLQQLDKFLLLARYSSLILKIAFGISFFYNAIALSVAVSGHLTPMVAAILMPLSSMSVVGFSTLAVNLVAKRVIGEPQLN
jgi:P-type Cu+ transporter